MTTPSRSPEVPRSGPSETPTGGPANTPASAVSLEGLRQAIQSGEAGLRTYINQGADRQKRANRAKEVLALLKSNTDFQVEQKKLVIAAARQIIQESLDHVTEELRSAVPGKLKELQG